IPAAAIGIPLRDSIVYAGALVDMKLPEQMCSTLPILLAVCGHYLSQNGTHNVGIFRVSGSLKRIQEIHQAFDTPPDYGASLDLSQFTIHDIASLFRRYLTLLPEPVIPVEHYQCFREVLDLHSEEPLSYQIERFRELIAELPEAERTVLLYVISFLAFFANFSEHTRMDVYNLAAIFQPGLLVHPMHTLSPDEYKRSQKIIEFFIIHHENFVTSFPNFTFLSVPTPASEHGDPQLQDQSISTNDTSLLHHHHHHRHHHTLGSTRNSPARNDSSPLHRPLSEYAPDDDVGSVNSTVLVQRLTRAVSSPHNATLATGQLSRVRRGRAIRENLQGPPNVRRAVTDYLYHRSRNSSTTSSLSTHGGGFHPRSHVAPPPGSSLTHSPKKHPGKSSKTIYSSVGRGSNVVFSTTPPSHRTPPKGSYRQLHLDQDTSRPQSQVVFSGMGVMGSQPPTPSANTPIPPEYGSELPRSPSADLIRENPFTQISVPSPANSGVPPPEPHAVPQPMYDVEQHISDKSVVYTFPNDKPPSGHAHPESRVVETFPRSSQPNSSSNIESPSNSKRWSINKLVRMVPRVSALNDTVPASKNNTSLVDDPTSPSTPVDLHGRRRSWRFRA
ncbi:GTPase activating protein (GAP) for Rho1p, partial [Dispira parvispora]